MRTVLLWLVDHVVVATLSIVVVTFVLATQALRVQIDDSVEGMMVKNDPSRRHYDEAKRRFGGDELTVLLVKGRDVFTPDVLRAIRRLSEETERLDGVTRVESLTTVRSIRADGDFLDIEPLIGPEVPTNIAELARIRTRAFANPILVGNLVSSDGRATAINVYTVGPPGDREFNRRFVRHLDRLIEREAVPGLSIVQIGSPLMKVTFRDYVNDDQIRLVPIALVAVCVVLWLALRSVMGVIIPLTTGLVSIVWALGLMALCGLPITAITVIIPALLISIGFTEDVHMIAEYRHLVDGGRPRLQAIRSMCERTAVPILVTTSTTVLGFATLVTTDITMLIQFGYAASLGLIANFVVTVVLLPVMLRFWPLPVRTPEGAPRRRRDAERLPRLMQRLARWNLANRGRVGLVTLVVVGAALAGTSALRVNSDFLGYFPTGSAIRQRTEDLHRTLAGALDFLVVVDTGRPDGVKSPELLRQIGEIQTFLASTGKIDKTVSVADYVAILRREVTGDPARTALPASREEIAQYLLLLEGTELARYVDFTGASAAIVVRHHIASSYELATVLQQLEAKIAAVFPPDVTVRVTGEGILINRAADYMVLNQVTSFASTFVLIALIHSVLFRSLRAGLLSLIPNVVPVLVTLGVMGGLGIPLNTGTALVATIALGIAVDDTVHHMIAYSRYLRESPDPATALQETLRSQGPPIIYVSLALAAGFGILAASHFVPTIQFGLLSAFVMLVAMVSELVLTPVLLSSVRLVAVWDAAPKVVAGGDIEADG